MSELIPAGYESFLKEVKERLRTAQLRAMVAVNAELVRLYWDIGQGILAKQQTEGWGTKIIERLS